MGGINLKSHEFIGSEDVLLGIEGLTKVKIFSIAITHGEEADLDKANIVLKSTKQLNLSEIIK